MNAYSESVENCPIADVQKIVRGKWTMVEYSLTPIGMKFIPVLEALEQWAIEYNQSQE